MAAKVRRRLDALRAQYDGDHEVLSDIIDCIAEDEAEIARLYASVKERRSRAHRLRVMMEATLEEMRDLQDRVGGARP